MTTKSQIARLIANYINTRSMQASNELDSAIDDVLSQMNELAIEAAQAQQLAADRLLQMQADERRALRWRDLLRECIGVIDVQQHPELSGVVDKIIAELSTTESPAEAAEWTPA